MDPLSDMLSGIRADRASINRATLEPSWAIRFADGAALTMLTIMKGEGRLVLHDGTERKLRAGSTALVRGPEPFRLLDLDADAGQFGRSHQVSCADTQAGSGLRQDPDGSTTFAVGAYRALRPRHERLLRALPQVLVLDEDIEDVLWLKGLDDALAYQGRPGGQSLTDRVLDWGLVCTLSCWFHLQGPEAPNWFRGVLDPVAGPALAAIHRDPRARWTVASLAAEAGVSRAHFAKRFTEVMGESPLAYLTEWRMCLAEDLLEDPEKPVAEVARSVGYADPFAFSTAFKRRRGSSPRAFRSLAASGRG
ncbi:AraC family transcriptional regulator [Glycomyces albidus]|uniref:Helix-turn-helix domain-containing protein n=1 Tax=Glycomyces albidus TaxID=2656774 RepID=A0A6L5GA51_9ACTN|nr:AraC family transcriptional regulator [Glycomyces albidus]MQM26582.1 helix-turn-helix domain-containing protein [Glycomyces albidus]